MPEDEEPHWQNEPQLQYESEDNWDDRLRQANDGEDSYEEWTWDR